MSKKKHTQIYTIFPDGHFKEIIHPGHNLDDPSKTIIARPLSAKSARQIVQLRAEGKSDREIYELRHPEIPDMDDARSFAIDLEALTARTLLQLLRQTVDAPLESLEQAEADDLRPILQALTEARDIHIIYDTVDADE